MKSERKETRVRNDDPEEWALEEDKYLDSPCGRDTSGGDPDFVTHFHYTLDFRECPIIEPKVWPNTFIYVIALSTIPESL